MSWKDDIEENLKYGTVEVLILKLLSERDMYGYEIKTELYKRSNEAVVIKEGSLYGPLYRMQEKKLISSRKEMVGPKRFRNYYHLDDDGKQYLEIALERLETFFNGANAVINWKNEE